MHYGGAPLVALQRRVIRAQVGDSDAPEPLGAVNEGNNENVFRSQLVHKPIRFHEEFANRLVSKFRHRLTPLCEIGEGRGRFTCFLDKAAA